MARKNDIRIVYSWHAIGEPQLYRVFDFTRGKLLFGPAPRRECQAWMRENTP